MQQNPAGKSFCSISCNNGAYLTRVYQLNQGPPSQLVGQPGGQFNKASDWL